MESGADLGGGDCSEEKGHEGALPTSSVSAGKSEWDWTTPLVSPVHCASVTQEVGIYWA